MRCLYFLAQAADAPSIRTAEDSGFRLVDIRVELQRAALTSERPAALSHTPADAFRPYRPSDLPALRILARQSFRDTRFYQDPHFPGRRCDDLYETWALRSCTEGFADAVFVADLGGMAGFVTCHMDRKQRRGRIGLIAVAEKRRGQGAGSSLLDRALRWFCREGAQTVEVTTQGRNTPALRLYQRADFTVHSLHLWYHKWFEEH